MQTGIIHEKQDLTNLSWSSICSPFEMTGSFLKALGIDHLHYQLIHADSTLKENGICFYDEFALLLKSEGRCAQDSFYISEITL